MSARSWRCGSGSEFSFCFWWNGSHCVHAYICRTFSATLHLAHDLVLKVFIAAAHIRLFGELRFTGLDVTALCVNHWRHSHFDEYGCVHFSELLGAFCISGITDNYAGILEFLIIQCNMCKVRYIAMPDVSLSSASRGLCRNASAC